MLQENVGEDGAGFRETLDMVSGENNRIHQNTTNKITND